MPFPIKTCVICHEQFELHPGKPGFANRCPSCSEPEESAGPEPRRSTDYAERRAELDRSYHAENRCLGGSELAFASLSQAWLIGILARAAADLDPAV